MSDHSDSDDLAAIAAMKQKAQKRKQKSDQAPPKKRHRAESSAESKAPAEHEDDHVQSEESDGDDLINIEFRLCDMLPIDFHTIKAMILVHLFDDKKFSDKYPFSDLADAISEQYAVGTTIKAEGTEEPLGFLTCLPLQCKGTTAKESLASLPKYFSMLLEHVKSRVSAVSPELDSVLVQAAQGSARLGFLFSDRFVFVFLSNHEKI